MPRTLGKALGLPSGLRCVAMPVRRQEDGVRQEEASFAGEWATACAGMSPKRRGEFVAGRRCAARALADAGGPLAGCLARGADRLPVWPRGWLGSISHSAGWAVAVVGEAAHYRALGIDIQETIGPDAVDGVEPLIAMQGEAGRLSALLQCCAARRNGNTCARNDAALQRRRALTLLFSAKEALYKALYPLTRRFQDFDAAAMGEWRPGAMRLTLTRDWDARAWPAGASIWLRYAWVGDMVATAVCLPVMPPADDKNP
jgi:enterobactin synthetase component D